MESPHERCPGCGDALAPADGPAHAYIGASPACWARYGEVLASSYEDPAYGRVNQVVVDTYAVQHPGIPERRAIQSVAVHLMTLALVLEDDLDPIHGRELHRRMTADGEFEWLDPPPMEGRLTVAAALAARGPSEHERLVHAWAKDVWRAWEPHHDTVRRWIRESLG